MTPPDRPARGAGFQVLERAPKFPRPGALRRPEARARALHTFLHHEVQAAELYGRALLLFRDAPLEYRAGLLRVALDEIRHARGYAGLLEGLGVRYGDLPVRDWFWERGVQCTEPLAFCAFVGIGLEGANLDHAERFALAFERAGDDEAARLQRLVGREEEAHVRFAQTWFERFSDGSFEAWRDALPRPLTPRILRGAVLDRAGRLRAGQSESFLDALDAWADSGS